MARGIPANGGFDGERVCKYGAAAGGKYSDVVGELRAAYGEVSRAALSESRFRDYASSHGFADRVAKFIETYGDLEFPDGLPGTGFTHGPEPRGYSKVEMCAREIGEEFTEENFNKEKQMKFVQLSSVVFNPVAQRAFGFTDTECAYLLILYSVPKTQRAVAQMLLRNKGFTNVQLVPDTKKQLGAVSRAHINRVFKEVCGDGHDVRADYRVSLSDKYVTAFSRAVLQDGSSAWEVSGEFVHYALVHKVATLAAVLGPARARAAMSMSLAHLRIEVHERGQSQVSAVEDIYEPVRPHYGDQQVFAPLESVGRTVDYSVPVDAVVARGQRHAYATSVAPDLWVVVDHVARGDKPQVKGGAGSVDLQKCETRELCDGLVMAGSALPLVPLADSAMARFRSPVPGEIVDVVLPTAKRGKYNRYTSGIVAMDGDEWLVVGADTQPGCSGAAYFSLEGQIVGFHIGKRGEDSLIVAITADILAAMGSQGWARSCGLNQRRTLSDVVRRRLKTSKERVERVEVLHGARFFDAKEGLPGLRLGDTTVYTVAPIAEAATIETVLGPMVPAPFDVDLGVAAQSVREPVHDESCVVFGFDHRGAYSSESIWKVRFGKDGVFAMSDVESVIQKDLRGQLLVAVDDLRIVGVFTERRDGGGWHIFAGQTRPGVSSVLVEALRVAIERAFPYLNRLAYPDDLLEMLFEAKDVTSVFGVERERRFLFHARRGDLLLKEMVAKRMLFVGADGEEYSAVTTHFQSNVILARSFQATGLSKEVKGEVVGEHRLADVLEAFVAVVNDVEGNDCATRVGWDVGVFGSSEKLRPDICDYGRPRFLD